MSVTFNEGVIESLLSPSGPVAAFVDAVMETTVLPEARDALAIPAIRFTSNRVSDEGLRGPPILGRGASTVRNTWSPNPPPGPPYRRSGDLIASLGFTPAIREGRWLVSYGTAPATHGGFLYPELLRQRGYKFLPLDDPRFHYGDVDMNA